MKHFYTFAFITAVVLLGLSVQAEDRAITERDMVLADMKVEGELIQKRMEGLRKKAKKHYEDALNAGQPQDQAQATFDGINQKINLAIYQAKTYIQAIDRYANGNPDYLFDNVYYLRSSAGFGRVQNAKENALSAYRSAYGAN